MSCEDDRCRAVERCRVRSSGVVSGEGSHHSSRVVSGRGVVAIDVVSGRAVLCQGSEVAPNLVVSGRRSRDWKRPMSQVERCCVRSSGVVSGNGCRSSRALVNQLECSHIKSWCPEERYSLSHARTLLSLFSCVMGGWDPFFVLFSFLFIFGRTRQVRIVVGICCHLCLLHCHQRSVINGLHPPTSDPKNMI